MKKRSLRSLVKSAAKDMSQVTPQSYLESYNKIANAQYNRLMNNYQNEVNSIKEKFKTPRGAISQEGKKELRKLDRSVKYWKRAVESTSKVLEDIKAGRVRPKISEPSNNEKLKVDKIYSFNLPAGHTCPGKGGCFGPCYALAGRQDMPKQFNFRVKNWAGAEHPSFVDQMHGQIVGLPKDSKFRIHDSGDFYSQDYINKWADIIKKNPHVNFYAYTKSYSKPDLDLSPLHQLPNMKLIQSVGSMNDDAIDITRPHAVIFPNTPEARSAAKDMGYHDASESDAVAADPKNIKLVLFMHGKNQGYYDPSKIGMKLKGPAGDWLRNFASSQQQGQPVKKSELNKAEDAPALPWPYTFDQPDLIHQAYHRNEKHSGQFKMVHKLIGAHK